MELGNEINWNTHQSFPKVIAGRVFNIDDLDSNPQARFAAKGLAPLKEVRDRSRLNQRTPILSAGLA